MDEEQLKWNFISASQRAKMDRANRLVETNLSDIQKKAYSEKIDMHQVEYLLTCRSQAAMAYLHADSDSSKDTLLGYIEYYEKLIKEYLLID